MTDESDEMVAFRLGPRDRAAIQRLVETGEFRNRSDFLRYAVKTTLGEFEGRRPPRARLDLELEGVDLPASAAAKQRPAGRTRKGVNL